jgi:hypothetical protein
VNIRPVLGRGQTKRLLRLGGTFDKFGFNIAPYRAMIPVLQNLIGHMRRFGIPVYYSKAICEKSRLDCIDKIHRIIPESHRERIENCRFASAGPGTAKSSMSSAPIRMTSSSKAGMIPSFGTESLENIYTSHIVVPPDAEAAI